jgi:hypothetical protein
MKGKPWTPEAEKQLRDFVEAKTPLSTIAIKMGLSQDAVQKKCDRLGLEVVGGKAPMTTTSISAPANLPSVEETLGKLAGALDAACKPGLDKVEVQRLQVVATIAKTYKEILADYLDYRGLELELQQMSEKYELLAKKPPSIPAKQVS